MKREKEYALAILKDAQRPLLIAEKLVALVDSQVLLNRTDSYLSKLGNHIEGWIDAELDFPHNSFNLRRYEKIVDSLGEVAEGKSIQDVTALLEYVFLEWFQDSESLEVINSKFNHILAYKE